ncbi:MAG: hypothetical protein RBR38_01415 [Desulfomicrobium apsheronum]|nr:hypothetical protein [Desulfomicrobium apsheronum]
MKTKFVIYFLFLVITTVSCAAPQLTKKTESGYPEGRFWKTDINTVKSAIIEGCTRKGFLICEESQNQIVFSKLTSGGQLFLAQLFMGNKYSTHPEKKLNLTFIVRENLSLLLLKHI